MSAVEHKRPGHCVDRDELLFDKVRRLWGLFFMLFIQRGRDAKPRRELI
jgi:hypothetical protein